MIAPNDSTSITTAAAGSALPANLPAGAKAFQAAVDNKLTTDVWSTILEAQIEKAKNGDRGAAKFLLEYAGGVASMRGATFVQETHNHSHGHSHYHEDGQLMNVPQITNGEPPDRTPDDFVADRERNARRVAARIAGGK